MSGRAPGNLELLRSLVNTREVDTGEDELETPAQLHGWLSEQSLLDDAASIDAAAHEKVLEFREAVRALGMANGSAEVDPGAVATLNRLADEAVLSVRVDFRGEADLQASGEGIDHALGRLFSIMYTATVDGTFSRLKGCANDACQWLFYDQSKNRSKKWCHMQACGNVINARAYRQRHRQH
jgi:predicted RNA-binding Zn ribbon-like protein